MDLSRKVRTTLNLDKEVVKKAKELGLNISKVSENALILAIESMEKVYGTNNSENSSISSSKNEKVD
jgi:post-segregation antitoxin (ccd killing protein)